MRPLVLWLCCTAVCAAADFGISIHWGVYSVPAWAARGESPASYSQALAQPGSATSQFHARTYGTNFAYRDFASQFRAELFDPDAWAKLFAASGARSVVLNVRGADGFCLWPSAEAPKWNSAEAGSHRDLTGDLAKAVRARKLKFGITYAAGTSPAQIEDLKRRYQPDSLAEDRTAIAGHNRNAALSDYPTAAKLVAHLADAASKGQDFVLDLGPTADGQIPLLMEERLRQLGRWLAINREAISGTQPWSTAAEGDIRFTARGDAIYAIVPKPGPDVTIGSISQRMRVELLGYNGSIGSMVQEGKLHIGVPPAGLEHAWVFKLTGVK